MRFVSTRGHTEPKRFSEAVRLGLAPDGGLFVPEKILDLSREMLSWEGESYPSLCCRFLKHFADDIDPEELKDLVDRSYRQFDHPEHAPLLDLSSRIGVLELFHGPTLAFKDFALQLLGNLYERQVRQTGEAINVLGATSGDTGAAAISGLIGKRGVNLFILYPDGRISPLQERQMACTGETNVFPLAIGGSFDDAQAALKQVFGDQSFRSEVGLSAVNSINLARILAQCVYYIYAWLKVPASRRENTTFVVPTGNFGNVLAGWMASKMGMNVKGFRVATNRNDILYRFFASGDYSAGEVVPSLAPSMDIQVASNFERFVYYGLDGNGERTKQVMEGFMEHRSFDSDDIPFDCSISSTRMDDKEIRKTISEVHERYNYLLDPHTACSFKDLDCFDYAVVLSTAHPAKFPEIIKETVSIEVTHPRLEALKNKEILKYPLSPNASSIRDFIRSKL